MDAEPMDVPIGGIHIIFDPQVSSDDEDPDVVHLWVSEELKVTRRKNHKTDRGRANDMVKMHKSIKESEGGDRKSTRLNSSHSQISYAVFCLKKKKEPAVIPAMLAASSILSQSATLTFGPCRWQAPRVLAPQSTARP